MSEYTKPLPEIDEDNQAFWDAAKRHELVVQRCQSCGAYYFPASSCIRCDNSKMEWVRVSGKGKVFTFVIFHQLYHPAFKDDIPYNTAVIELDEGPLMLSNVVGCKNENIEVGMPVQVVFDDITEEVTLPRFRAVA